MIPTEFSISFEGRNKPWTRNYVQIETIGSGSMVDVYGVRDLTTNWTGVAKQAINHTNNKFVATEADTLNRIGKAPGFPELHDWGKDGTTYWIVTSRLKGNKFSEVELFQLPKSIKLKIIRSYADRIQTAWDHRVLLTDYKPDNFLYDETGDGVGIYDLNVTRRLPESEQSVPEFAKVVRGQVERMKALNPPFSEGEISHVLQAYKTLVQYGIKHKDKYTGGLYNEGSMARMKVIEAINLFQNSLFCMFSLR